MRSRKPQKPKHVQYFYMWTLTTYMYISSFSHQTSHHFDAKYILTNQLCHLALFQNWSFLVGNLSLNLCSGHTIEKEQQQQQQQILWCLKFLYSRIWLKTHKIPSLSGMKYLFSEHGHFKDWSPTSKSKFYGQNFLIAHILIL